MASDVLSSLSLIIFGIFFLKDVFIYFWLHWIFVTVCRLSLVAASGASSIRCVGLSCQWLLLLQSTGSAVEAHGVSCSAGGGIFPGQGLNPCLLHWQEDSQPLDH